MMYHPKHTPGPWKADVITGEVCMDDDVGALVGEVSFDTVDTYESRLQACADTLLMAAAPSLAEALYRLKTECEIEGLTDKPGFDCWISMANKALLAAQVVVHGAPEDDEQRWIHGESDDVTPEGIAKLSSEPVIMLECGRCFMKGKIQFSESDCQVHNPPDEVEEPDHWYEALYSDRHGYWYVDRRDKDGGETIEINLSQDKAEAMAASLNGLQGKIP